MMNAFLLLTLLPFTTASAIRLQAGERSTGTFSIPLVRNPNYVANGPAELQRAYAKHGIVINTNDDYLRKRGMRHRNGRSLEKRGTRHSVGRKTKPKKGYYKRDIPAERAHHRDATGDLEYYATEITIGGQSFNVVLDTSSGDSWVASTPNPGDQRQSERQYHGQARYTNWDIALGESTTISGQSIGLAEEIAPAAFPAGAGAVLGLGPQHSARERTFVENLVSQKAVSKPVFSVDIRHDGSGSFDFSALNQGQYEERLQWTPIDNTRNSWSVPSTKFKVGHSEHLVEPAVAVLDTASKFLLLSEFVVQEYWSHVEHAEYDIIGDSELGVYKYPCDATNPLPNISLDVGGTFVEIPGFVLNAGPLDDGKFCLGGVQSAGPDAPMWVYGDIFFKAAFVAFDFGAIKRIGHAPKSL